MQWYHYTLLALAIFAGVSSWHVPRAGLWLGLLAGSFVSSVIWHRLELPGALVFGAVTNFVICGVVSWQRQKTELAGWEMGYWNAIIFMIVIDFLYAMGYIASHSVFAKTLEFVNAAILLIIASPGAVQWVKRNGYFSSDNSRAADLCNRVVLAHRPRHARWWKEP